MSLYHRVAPLHIYGPSNLGPVIKFYLSYFGSDIGYEIVFHPLVRSGKSASSALLCNPVRENAPQGNCLPVGERLRELFREVRTDEPGKIWTFSGKCEGRIATTPAGCGGFGYDPVFIPDAYPDRTLAEVDEDAKNAISHRGNALRDMLRFYSARKG